MWKKYVQPLMAKAVSAVKPLLGMGDDAVKAAVKLSPYDEARDTTKMLKGMVETGLTSTHADDFAKHGLAVLQGPQSGNFAHDVAKAAAAAVKADAKSPEAFKLLVASHQKLEGNIAQRAAQAKIVHAPEELRALHTNNIRDARAMIETGAPVTQKDKAYEAIVRGLDSLSHSPGNADVAKRLAAEINKDPVLRVGVTDAARRIHTTEEAARKAAAAAPTQPALPHTQPVPATGAHKPADYGPDGNRDARLRNLGVTPEQRPSLSAPGPNAYDPEIARAQAAFPSSLRPVTPPQNSVELYALQQQRAALGTGRITDLPVGEAREISMDAFKAAEREAAEALARAAAKTEAPAATAVGRTFDARRAPKATMD